MNSKKTESGFPVNTPDLENLDDELRRVIQNYLQTSSKSESPILIHMLGVPGSGKSTVARTLFGAISSFPVTPLSYVGFDQIMSEIPSYKRLDDKVAAFEKFELPAREAGYTLLRRLIENKVSILLDHGGSAKEHPKILKLAKELYGYKVFVFYVDVSREIVAERIRKRAAVEGRHTPENYIPERFEAISSMIPEYRDAADQFFQVENNSPKDLLGILSSHVLDYASAVAQSTTES